MPRYRSRRAPISSVGLNTPPQPGLISRPQNVKPRNNALLDLVGSILVGPPLFPIKQLTAMALFELALDRLAPHDKTMVEALRRYASQFARLEILELKAFTFGLPPADVGFATLKWWMEEPSPDMTDDLGDDFDRYRRVVGKRSCHSRTLRRQHELLQAYGRAHKYPAGAHIDRIQRRAWGRAHLPAMIGEAQLVSCWHPQHDLTKQDLDEVLNDIDEKTSLIQMSALVLAHLHSTTTDYLLKRLLPRRRR
ncbi:MAG: hypothetical protein ABIU05_25270 [Nitrospirales bacterium]